MSEPPPLARDEELCVTVPAYVAKVRDFVAAKQGQTPEQVMRMLLHLWTVDIRISYPEVDDAIPGFAEALASPDVGHKPRIARRVTRKHGEIFAEALLRHMSESLAPNEAFGETGLIVWPTGYLHDHADQDRYRDLEDEILGLTFAAIRGAISAAFVKAAREVLRRERQRRSKLAT